MNDVFCFCFFVCCCCCCCCCCCFFFVFVFCFLFCFFFLTGWCTLKNTILLETNGSLNSLYFIRGFICRRAIWYRLVNIVSPLASEMYAFTDYNLHLLAKHPKESWQHRLWLAIFADHSLSPLHYKDFISPKDNVIRDRAPVKVMGAGDRHFAANIPFSWLLKGNMEAKYKSTLEKRGKIIKYIYRFHTSVSVFLKSVLNFIDYFLLRETIPSLKSKCLGLFESRPT